MIDKGAGANHFVCHKPNSHKYWAFNSNQEMLATSRDKAIQMTQTIFALLTHTCIAVL